MSRSAQKALELLKEGNSRYIEACISSGDISPQIRRKTAKEGQQPYAAILCCSDSREIPEAIFMAGIGDLFVIRVAGNVIDSHQLGSIEYAAEHLGTRLVLVLGHTHCGAVHAAIHHETGGNIGSITDRIRRAIGDETDEYRASVRNIRQSVKEIKEDEAVKLLEAQGLQVIGGIYHIDTGQVEFLQNED